MCACLQRDRAENRVYGSLVDGLIFLEIPIQFTSKLLCSRQEKKSDRNHFLIPYTKYTI